MVVLELEVEDEKNMLFETSKQLSSLFCNDSLRSPSSSGSHPPLVFETNNASKATNVKDQLIPKVLTHTSSYGCKYSKDEI
ncbi:hypothetical protein TanjilG_21933 [Lupinus angustifolius]|uniref:Uncharacterized protein n=1 Tax=Lupinus angustifolius TaxID=3871 RepID=A0A1J7HB89_LUPAN|nr:hypothetical protein TanjilG_21933 [Lupinus angustifolius]